MLIQPERQQNLFGSFPGKLKTKVRGCSIKRNRKKLNQDGALMTLTLFYNKCLSDYKFNISTELTSLGSIYNRILGKKATVRYEHQPATFSW